MHVNASDFMRRHPVAVQLPLRFEAEPLRHDVSSLPESWWHRHLGPYHNGGWEVVSLWAPGGDFRNQTTIGAPFAATEALERSPALQRAIDEIPGTKNRIRLMRLRPGGEIRRHSDPLSELDPNLVRLHVPVTTNPSVDFRVNDRRLTMHPGTLWHVDVRFPHAVRNDGTEPRVHLVLDVLRSSELDALFAAGEEIARGRLTFYFAKHLLPRRLLLRLGWAN
jgi:quercetin dioxygenase-like cupin family protein